MIRQGLWSCFACACFVVPVVPGSEAFCFLNLK